MAKTSEKTFQIIQPRRQTALKSMQDLLLPRGLSAIVSFPLRILPGWADILNIARRHWLRRLPAVITAAVLLCTFMSAFGIGKEELVLAAFVSLAGLACFVVLEGMR